MNLTEHIGASPILTTWRPITRITVSRNDDG